MSNAMSTLIVGVDEAGRGPLAGPVVAAAVILSAAHPVLGLADSQKTQPGPARTVGFGNSRRCPGVGSGPC